MFLQFETQAKHYSLSLNLAGTPHLYTCICQVIFSTDAVAICAGRLRYW